MDLGGGIDRELGELVLAGAAPAVLRFAESILAADAVVSFVPMTDRPAVDPLERLEVVRVEDEREELSRSGTQAVLRASGSQLRALAEELRAFTEHNDLTRPGMHHHTAVGRVPVIVAGPVPDV
jgi:hypothetical protein